MTLPLPLRNRLAELIIDAFHDAAARDSLETLVAACADPGALGESVPPRFPIELFEHRGDGWRIRAGYRAHAADLAERAGRAARALAGRPLATGDPPLAEILDEAASLFEAGLYFEVHELLEPSWIRADGATRQGLQGLIQVAVGFQHLANGNVEGARALLHEGAAKLLGQRLEGRDADGFARSVAACEREVIRLGDRAALTFDWTRVPRFPAAG